MGIFGKPAAVDVSDLVAKLKQLDSTIRSVRKDLLEKKDVLSVVGYAKTFSGQLSGNLRNSKAFNTAVLDASLELQKGLNAFINACENKLFSDTRQMKDQFNMAVITRYNSLLSQLKGCMKDTFKDFEEVPPA